MRINKTFVFSCLISITLLATVGCKSAGEALGKAAEKAKQEITNGATNEAKKTINDQIRDVKKKFSASANSCEELDDFMSGLNENGGIAGLEGLSASAKGAGLTTEASEIDDLVKQLKERICECHPTDPICDNDESDPVIVGPRSVYNL